MTARIVGTEVSEQLAFEYCVHLILRLAGDWERDREAMAKQVEHRIEQAERYSHTSAFRKQFGKRAAVLRVQAQGPAPSIVEYLLNERGVEVENVQAVLPQDGPSCVDCGREHLSERQAVMSGRGWACPSCHRGYRLWLQPQGAAKRSSLQVPTRVLWPLLAVLTLLFFAGVGYELRNLGEINQAMHVR